ncbi:putative OmpL-like beta-barrel porin-2 [Arcticibacter tournemirensis]|uniref:Porin n=1 Tax=Arcticibacter tournemirensis TaxID=699437 RepID=A0A5M9HIB6_9SPHI|nr:porin [Arcticibacter tournemirensis]KAA8486776.1 porin [Arcticibacter tournemirensis]TQM49319.1 putative OmpL-like beta-barrel porin-2 [Arcticibacter tournemirensis]
MTTLLKNFFTAALIASGAVSVNAQDSAAVSPLQISGSVDTYYKYDFSGYKPGNIPTAFASENNSLSLGMIDLALKKSSGKASFVGEVSFGPRGQYQSLPNSDNTYEEGNGYNSFHIQNLYASYQFTEKFSMTAGYMGTFVGYEVISPVGNFNYSTSYLFSNGPFQNAGIKANYAFSDKVGLMVGLFNDWNVYQDFNGVSDFGAQLFLSPVEGWSAYVNFITGYPSGTEIDLTTSYQLTESFKLGLNVADMSRPSDAGGFSGGALYLQNAFSPTVSLGVRGEYFKSKKNEALVFGPVADESVFALTFSGNVKAGPLTVIPEVRFDNGSVDMFYKKNGVDMTKSAAQFSIAAVYAF